MVGNALKRKILRHEPLEERQLLAVDVLGRLGDFGDFSDDHDSSCVSHISCYEATHLEETGVVFTSASFWPDKNYC